VEATAQLMRTEKGAEIEYAIPFAGACAGTSIITGAAAETPLSSLFDGAGAGAEGWLFVAGSITGYGGDSVGGAGSGTEDGGLAA